MTRPKAKPSISKPDFSSAVARGSEPAGKLPVPPQPDETAKRLPVTLLLKRDVIARLEHEALRKERSIAQVVEKLVAKHLDKD